MSKTWKDITGRYIDLDDSKIFYDEIGQGGRPIICIHTAGASSLEYRYLLPLLADAGFHAIAPDLPGHSRSMQWKGERSTSMHRHAEFIQRLKTALFGEEKAIVTGTSIGGVITLDIAVSYPDSYAAAIPFSGAARTPTFPDPYESLLPSWNPGWHAMLASVAGASLYEGAPPEMIKELQWFHKNAQESAIGDLQGWANHDIRDKLSQATLPVLVACGREDFWVPEEIIDETVAGLPNAEKLMIDGIAHFPMFEKPELTLSIIVDFLKRKGI